MKKASLSVIILAAGKGTRMKSDTAKVLHQTFFQPMVCHVIDSVAALTPAQIILVVGHQKERVQKIVEGHIADCTFVYQKDQNGTGHAVLTTQEAIDDDAETVLILCGDTPLIRLQTLQRLYDFHKKQQNDITLLTTTLNQPCGYGRILCDDAGNIVEIVEEKDASDSQRQITMVNAGIYCVEKRHLFTMLDKVGTDNKQNEMYLTDIVGIGVQEKRRIRPFHTDEPLEVLGVNSRQELAEADHALQLQRNRALMAEGVSMISPETVRVSPCSQVGVDSLLEQNVVIINSKIGKNVTIGMGAYIANTIIPEGSIIAPHSFQQ